MTNLGADTIEEGMKKHYAAMAAEIHGHESALLLKVAALLALLKVDHPDSENAIAPSVTKIMAAWSACKIIFTFWERTDSSEKPSELVTQIRMLIKLFESIEQYDRTSYQEGHTTEQQKDIVVKIRGIFNGIILMTPKVDVENDF